MMRMLEKNPSIWYCGSTASMVHTKLTIQTAPRMAPSCRANALVCLYLACVDDNRFNLMHLLACLLFFLILVIFCIHCFYCISTDVTYQFAKIQLFYYIRCKGWKYLYIIKDRSS